MSQPDPTPGSQEEARRKVKAAFLHPGRGQIWIALALAILGFAAVIQVRVSGQDDAYETMRLVFGIYDADESFRERAAAVLREA